MLIALACVTVLALAALALLAQQQKAHTEAQAQWASERRELCNRIVAPERVPFAALEHFELPDQEPDEIDKVGTITFGSTEDELDAVGTGA